MCHYHSANAALTGIVWHQIKTDTYLPKYHIRVGVGNRFNPNQGGKCPAGENPLYWPYLCILCNKNWIKALWGHKVNPHWVYDPPWSFNGPCHSPTIHPTMKILSSVFCKHSIFDSTKRFFNKNWML